MQDLKTFVVKSPKEMNDLMDRGKVLRVVAGHDMNQRSSRSHSLFSIIVDNCETSDDGEEHIRTGKLNLVDLAGSERQAKTHATGEVLNQAIYINQSLTCLGKVIAALVDDKSGHIPYRESKLTKLLMDSLGGNSKTVMIANIGPADANYEESVTTLRYANRAKNIKNAPKINEDPKDAMIRQYQEELNKLKMELSNLTGGGKMDSNGMIIREVRVNNKEKIEELEKQLQMEKELLEKEAIMEKKKIEESKNTAEDEKLKLLNKLKEKQIEQEKQAKNKEQLIEKLKCKNT